MSTMTIKGNVVQIRDMNITGGKLSKNFERKLDIDFDVSNCTREQELKLIGGGSSGRVKLQNKMRVDLVTEIGVKAAEAKLDELSKKVTRIDASLLFDHKATDLFLSAEEINAIRIKELLNVFGSKEAVLKALEGK